MPRGIKKIPVEPQVDITNPVDTLQKTVDFLAKQVGTILEKLNTEAKPVASKSMDSASAIPVPVDYRELVDTMLNKSFEIQMEALGDQPAFHFAIIVPETYSNMSAPYKEMYKIDKRARVINYSDGVNGVRDWVEKVYNNFDQDTRTRITMDRIEFK